MGSLKLTTASSGSVILSPANTASDVTITVPAVTGTMITTATAGTVLQVVQGSTTSSTQTSSGSFVTTSLNASITPSSSSSKILAIVNGNGDTEAAGRQITMTIYRGGTNLTTNGFSNTYNPSSRTISPLTATYLDSPSTTSSTTYTVYVASTVTAGTVTFNIASGLGAQPATITLMEIAA